MHPEVSVPVFKRPGLHFVNQAKFHPMSYLSGLAKTIPGWTLEIILVGDAGTPTDEYLPVGRLGDGDLRGVRQAGVVARHIAPTEEGLALFVDDLGDDLLHGRAHRGVLRHEDETDRVSAGGREGEAQTLRFLCEEGVRDLHQHAGAVAHLRVSADGTAMLEVVENLQPVLDDAVGLLVLEVDDEADAARVFPVQRIEEALGNIGAREHGVD